MDARPQIERSLTRARVACVLLIAAGFVVGGCLAGSVAIYLTRDRSA